MANAASNGHDDGGGGAVRPPRLPRWTRQEILVLIQGKKVAESRGRGRSRLQQMGSSAPLVGVGSPVEPKWATVSSYCRRHGVHRGPVQCRKRWSNLAGDFKKIKEWELRRDDVREGSPESFWSMRNDLRRERRLPGFFDREVYNILDGVAAFVADADDPPLKETVPSLPPPPAPTTDDDEEAAFDSGRPATDDALFSDFEPDEDNPSPPPAAAAAAAAVAATPISERKSDSLDPSSSDKEAPASAGKEAAEQPAAEQERSKRKREDEESPDVESRLLEILERNNKMLSLQMEAHNENIKLDREQRRELTVGVVQVLGKLADALARIADRL